MRYSSLFSLAFFMLLFHLPGTVFSQTPPNSGGGVAITIAPRGPVVTISGVTDICKGGETTLKVEGDFESFTWNNGNTGRYLKVKEEGVYEVSAKTKGGCTYTSSVVVRVRPCT